MTRLEPEEPPPAAQVRVGGAEQPREEGGAGGHAPPWGQDDPLDRGDNFQQQNNDDILARLLPKT